LSQRAGKSYFVGQEIKAREKGVEDVRSAQAGAGGGKKWGVPHTIGWDVGMSFQYGKSREGIGEKVAPQELEYYDSGRTNGTGLNTGNRKFFQNDEAQAQKGRQGTEKKKVN